MYQRIFGLASVALAVFTLSASAHAATFNGIVSDGNGDPIWGAMVTFKDEGGRRGETSTLEGVDPDGAAGRRLLELGEQVRRLRAENARLRRRLYV